jgi:hypothetical protein
MKSDTMGHIIYICNSYYMIDIEILTSFTLIKSENFGDKSDLDMFS